MVWLKRSPIPVGRRWVISSFKWFFYLSSLHVEEGGGGSAPYAPYSSSPPFFPAGPEDFSLKDDVTVSLLFCVSFMFSESELLKVLRSPRIDSKEPIPPGCVAWRAGTKPYSYSVPSPHRLFKNFSTALMDCGIFGFRKSNSVRKPSHTKMIKIQHT